MTTRGVKCGPCEREDSDSKSEFWCKVCSESLCKTCTKEHRKNKASCNHDVISLELISHMSDSVLTADSSCEKHGGHMISLFCVSHDELCCAMCIPASHKTCQSIISINEAAKGSGESSAFFDLENRVSSTISYFDSILESKTKNIKDIEVFVAAEKSGISNKIKSIISKLELVEKSKKHDLEERAAHCIEDLSSQKDNVLEKKNRLKVVSDDLKALKKHGSDLHNFIALKRLDKSQVILEKEVRNSLQQLHTKYELKSSTSVPIMLTFDDYFDNVKVTKTIAEYGELPKFNECQFLPLETSKLELSKRINLKEINDLKSPSLIWKTCYFSQHDRVVLTDTGKSCLYIYDIASDKFNILPVKGTCLWYVNVLDNDHAIVGFMYSNLLKVNIVKPKVISEISYSASDAPIIGRVGRYIVVIPSKSGMFIVFENERKIRECPLPSTTTEAVGFVCGYGPDKFIYTSYYENMVRCFTLEGKDVFKLSCVSPLGIVIDRYNYIYIATQRNGITRLKPDGSLDKTLHIDADPYPFSLAYKENTHELIVNTREMLDFYKIVCF